MELLRGTLAFPRMICKGKKVRSNEIRQHCHTCIETRIASKDVSLCAVLGLYSSIDAQIISAQRNKNLDTLHVSYG
jgi:hypothetical protein